MKKILFLLIYFGALFSVSLQAQTFYVDVMKGDDANLGTAEAPFQSLAKAVYHANSLTGTGEIVIRLQAGLYLLEDRIDINPVRIMSDTGRYIIEAAIMPDNEKWTPANMPVIQSISVNNSNTQFTHCTGLLVSSSHVTIRGLKFLGNANPMVDYYYPVSKEDKSLSDLELSQCYFIGNKEAAKIQGGVWAHGPDNTVSHCIFYGCRNSVLFFNNVEGFTIEHTIISGSYESAFWFPEQEYSFTFSNNIIANNACFLVKPEGLEYSSPFANSVIANNENFVGKWSREKQSVEALENPGIKLKKVQRTGEVSFQKNDEVRLDKKHLHLRSGAVGHDLKAGIF